MIEMAGHLIPIALGFFAKLIALKAEDANQRQQMMIQALGAREGALASAREYDTPMAALNRRTLIWFIMVVLMMSVIGTAIFDIPVLVEQTVTEPSYFFGLIGGKTYTEWVELYGVVSFEEFRAWGTMIFEMLFGATLARRS